MWQLAAPAVVTMLLQFVGGLADMYFVGRLGPAAQACVGMGGHVALLLMAGSMAVTTGAVAVMARHEGARERTSVVRTAQQCMLLSAVLALVAGAIVYALRREILGWLGADQEVIRAGEQYLVFQALGTLPQFTLLACTAILQSLGDLRTPLRIVAVVTAVNVLLDAVLVAGGAGIPAFGVVGAGMASASSRMAGALAAMALLARSGFWSGAPQWRVDLRQWYRILRIGYPTALQNVLRNLAFAGYTQILATSPQGTSAVAALFVGIRAEGLGYMPGVAYGRAASTLVGQSLGAGLPERARQFGWVCTWQALAVMSAFSALFYAAAHPIAAMFSQDPRVVELAASYLRINALAEPTLAFSIVLGGALQGAGDTRFQALVSVLCMWIVRLPATWWLMSRLGYDADAAWWTMAGSTAIQAVLIVWRVRRGAWQKILV